MSEDLINAMLREAARPRQGLQDAFEKAVYDFLTKGVGGFVTHIPMEDMYLPPPPKPYGCHNRAPITTVCAPTCQYTHSALGQADQRCFGCKERFNG